MSRTLAELEEQAQLVDALLESLLDVPSADVEAAWEREIDERIPAYDRGESQTYPAEDIFRESRHLSPGT